MIYNKILENLILPAGDFIFRGNYSKSLKLVRYETSLNEHELAKLQLSRLNHILDFARLNSRYYSSNIPDSTGLHPVIRLKQIPVLTKDLIRGNTDLMLTCSKKNLLKLSSSGSTGLQTEVYLSKRELGIDRAIQTVWWEWAGYKIGMPMLQTGLATHRTLEKRLKDYFFRTKYLFAFGLKDGSLEPYIPWITANQPFLGGYASSLYVLSELYPNKQLKFRGAVSWGDKLFKHYISNINRSFSCKVHETYGTGEGVKIGAQKDLEYLYIMTPYVYLEVVDDDGNEVKEGEIGHVLVTSLTNRSMPLIRYRLGDLAVKLPMSEYPQNRQLSLPLLKKVIGRETDIVRTPRGKRLIVHSFTGIFEYFPEIRQFCIVQNELGGVTVQYIKSPGFNSSILSQIRGKMEALIGEPFTLEFAEVDSIPPTKSGKPQIVLSNLK